VSTFTALTGTDEVLARLAGNRGRWGATDLAVVRDGPDTIVAIEPTDVVRADGADALHALDLLDSGWWAGFCSYDLGRSIERVPARNQPVGVPDVLFARFDARLVIGADGTFRLEGSGRGRAQLEQLLEAERTDTSATRLHAWRSSLDRDGWERSVAQIHRHLVAGDCYQVNLTRRLECDTGADPVALFRALSSRNPAPHAALVRIGDVAVVSASPERFLRRDGSRIETRPIKGTSSSAEELAVSEKDRAENVMIVDLARNDLGRVCEYGSVHVPALFEVERHPGLYHLVSTVAGTLRADVTTGDIIRATFPPASVTGCPKPRVLQIIEELEPVRRGVYCGAIGFVDRDREVMDLNVAIRTFVVTDGRTTLGVGGGIVADSDPTAEWHETELKARRLLEIASGD
jgi:para-aminobenzoate synthetase component 1